MSRRVRLGAGVGIGEAGQDGEGGENEKKNPRHKRIPGVKIIIRPGNHIAFLLRDVGA